MKPTENLKKNREDMKTHLNVECGVMNGMKYEISAKIHDRRRRFYFARSLTHSLSLIPHISESTMK